VVEVAETMSEVVLCRKEHFERVAGEVAEGRTNIALLTRHIRHLGLQLRKRCQQQQHQQQHTDHHHTHRFIVVLAASQELDLQNKYK